MEKSLLRLLLVYVFAYFVSSQYSPKRRPTVIAQSGDDVNFSWHLPDSLMGTVLVVSFTTPSNAVFFASTSSPSDVTAMVTHRYLPRIDVTPNLQGGLLKFTLRNVGPRDAGKYICMRGLTKADVVEDCGQTLVVIAAPKDANVIANGPLVIGHDVTLRCMASSVSVPRDHAKPMRFRWFEASAEHEEKGSLEWSEIIPDQNENLYELDRDYDDAADVGSGEPEGEVSRGSDSGSLSNALEIEALGKSDDGRRFACSASEGLSLWSQKSQPFVLKPEWKPSPSDLTFTPALNSVTVTVGGSTHVTCSANCRPECSIVWQKVISDDQAVTFTTAATLNLVSVGRQQQGAYRCLASNRHGNAFRSLALTVTDPPKPWFSDTTHVITVVAVVTVGLALGMTGVAVVVAMYRYRSIPIVWPRRKRASDTVPLSKVENQPRLMSYC